MVQVWKSYVRRIGFIRKETKLIKAELNSNWLVTSKLYRQGQEEWKIQERELQLAGLNCGYLDVGKETDAEKFM